ncbi:hypothetical protein LTR56_024313 [Elasticomyces elasticus]|nr:hypothetical protein LTR56_024313 [Elasticomyces elasticus]KAK4908193.1 hypothetical protein LTR49_022879 [Elasticomyces elasticus]
MQELDETERAALVFECDHKWNNPAMMWYSIGLCAIEAATQGRDQTGSNGANFSFPEGFRIHNGTQRHEWLVGLINAIIFMTAGLIGAFIVDPLNHYLGRRGEIFLTAMCLTATPIGFSFAKSWQGLFPPIGSTSHSSVEGALLVSDRQAGSFFPSGSAASFRLRSSGQPTPITMWFEVVRKHR